MGKGNRKLQLCRLQLEGFVGQLGREEAAGWTGKERREGGRPWGFIQGAKAWGRGLQKLPAAASFFRLLQQQLLGGFGQQGGRGSKAGWRCKGKGKRKGGAEVGGKLQQGERRKGKGRQQQKLSAAFAATLRQTDQQVQEDMAGGWEVAGGAGMRLERGKRLGRIRVGLGWYWAEEGNGFAKGKWTASPLEKKGRFRPRVGKGGQLAAGWEGRGKRLIWVGLTLIWAGSQRRKGLGFAASPLRQEVDFRLRQKGLGWFVG